MRSSAGRKRRIFGVWKSSTADEAFKTVWIEEKKFMSVNGDYVKLFSVLKAKSVIQKVDLPKFNIQLKLVTF